MTTQEFLLWWIGCFDKKAFQGVNGANELLQSLQGIDYGGFGVREEAAMKRFKKMGYHAKKKAAQNALEEWDLREFAPAEQPKPTSRFGEWFKKQFGREPLSIEQRVRLQERVQALTDHAKGQAMVLSDDVQLAEVHNAALKGWVAGYEAGRKEK